MRIALKFFALVIGLWLVRRAGVHIECAPASPQACDVKQNDQVAKLRNFASRPDVAQIVNLMASDPSIGLVLQTNRPGEQLQAVRFIGPGGQA